jgi:flagellum-specific peptidoglycan hydrolase FlgJ
MYNLFNLKKIKEVLNMRSQPKMLFIAYLFVMTLFLTLDMSLETKNIQYADASSSRSLETNLIVDFNKLSLSKPSMVYPSNLTFNHNEVEAKNDEQTIEKEMTNIETSVTNYEVTAYYLNIRLNASDMSKIVKAVPRGTVLEIMHITDKGWLNLKNGGYVNGKYAKPIDRNFKQTAQVTTLSVIHTKVNDVGAKPPQSTAFKDAVEASNKPTSSVKSDSGLIAAHIEKLLEGSSLAGHDLEKIIVEMEEEYGINAYFTIAVMKLESGYGKSSLSKNKNNLFGLNAIDGDKTNKAFSFKTKGDSVRKFGQLISKNYLGKGYTTIEKVSRKYCHANPKWSGLVISIMNSDYRKLQQM